MRAIWLRGVVIIVLISSGTQPSFSRESFGKRPKTAAEKLIEHHIGLTEPELLAALRNPNAEVRALAATQLSDDGARDAIPNMVEALASETEPLARVNIAYALTLMGDERGKAALTRTCKQHRTSPAIRAVAARYLLSVGDGSCLSAVLDSIDRATEAEDRSEAVSTLPEFHSFSKDEFERVDRTLLHALRDPAATVRIAASDALAKLGGKSDILGLHVALLAEKDQTVGSHMRAALQILQDNKKN